MLFCCRTVPQTKQLAHNSRPDATGITYHRQADHPHQKVVSVESAIQCAGHSPTHFRDHEKSEDFLGENREKLGENFAVQMDALRMSFLNVSQSCSS